MSSNFATYWSSITTRIDFALQDLLQSYRDQVPELLFDAIHYALIAPGKRARPLLVILAAEANDAAIESAIPAACAVEMIHTYSLIHDDLPAMDDDDLRRGRPTLHRQYDEAIAILAGDALLTLAFETMAKSYPPQIATVLILELARGAGLSGMIAGQIYDLQAEGRYSQISTITQPKMNLDFLQSIHRAKTGALFRSCVTIGAKLSVHFQPETFSHLLTYIDAFGLCFQITDDLLDVTSTEEKTGKKVGKDSHKGKLTYPGLLGVEESQAQANILFNTMVASAEKIRQPIRDYLFSLANYLIRRNS